MESIIHPKIVTTEPWGYHGLYDYNEDLFHDFMFLMDSILYI